ncbi:MAG TPA: GerAB/ArcD/ProY family transporter [Bacillales bacterium]|nr:GerAB/ArcD/ProY family transporter [Bacillales bacterium]
MTAGDNKVALYQFFFLFIQTEIGVSILSLPYVVFLLAHNDGWISMLLAGAITQILILILWMLCRRFRSSSIYVVSRKLFGKWIGSLLIIIYSVYFAATASIILVLFSKVINVWVLPHTPYWVTMVLMVIAGVYISRENLRVLARFYTFVSFLIIMLIAFMVYSLKDANYLYLFPIGNSSWEDILMGAKGATLSMLGFESLLVFYPLVKGTDSQKLKVAAFANLFVTLFYTLIILCCFLNFSPEEIPLLPEPLLYMFKAFSFTIIERIDLFFLSVWMVTVATSFMTYLFLASNGLAHLFRKKNHKPLVPIAALAIFIAAMIPKQNEMLIQALDQRFQQISILFVAVLPMLFLLFSYILHKKEASGQ